jgi:hypothetical protein
MPPHQSEFAARIARIESGSGSTKSTVFVGTDERYTSLPRQYAAAVRRARANSEEEKAPPSFIFCFTLGVVAYGLGQFARFKMAGLPDPATDADTAMLTNGAFGLAVLMALSLLMGKRMRSLSIAKVMGLAAGLVLFHNVVHLAPTVFERAFSPEWVAQVTASTEPQSLYWRGESITTLTPKAEDDATSI